MKLTRSLLLLALCWPVATLGSCVSSPASSAQAPEDSFDWSGERQPSSQTLLTMAHILANKGNDPQCELVLLKLLDEHPDCSEAYNDLAELYMREARPEDAQHVLESGVRRLPEDGILWNNLGMVHLLAERHEDAIQAFTNACAVAPSDARPRANLAVALALAQRIEEAEAVYLQATERSVAYHDLAVLCEANGDWTSAQRYRELARR